MKKSERRVVVSVPLRSTAQSIQGLGTLGPDKREAIIDDLPVTVEFVYERVRVKKRCQLRVAIGNLGKQQRAGVQGDSEYHV